MATGKKKVQARITERGGRAKLTAEDSLKRMQEFAERKENFIATVRQGKNRSVSA
jgi:hypothetical protein